jgi:hypothetical protein
MVEHGGGVGAIGECNVAGLGSTEPPGVVADHPVTLREGRHLLVPHLQAAQTPVDQQQWMTFTLDLVIDPAAIDLDEPGLAHGV